MNLTPPPRPSQNSHAVRWHCTAESRLRVTEIKLTQLFAVHQRGRRASTQPQTPDVTSSPAVLILRPR